MPNIVRYGCVALLLAALMPLPYGYYTLMRLVVSATFVWAALVSRKRQSGSLIWVFVFLALIFNPIIPIHLPMEIWAIFDIGSAILLLATGKLLSLRDNETSGKGSAS